MKPVAWQYTNRFGTFYTDDFSELLDEPGIESYTPLYSEDDHLDIESAVSCKEAWFAVVRLLEEIEPDFMLRSNEKRGIDAVLELICKLVEQAKSKEVKLNLAIDTSGVKKIIAEAFQKLFEPEPVRQYYYYDGWYDEGTGPFPDMKEGEMIPRQEFEAFWRDKPQDRKMRWPGDFDGVHHK